VSLELRYNVADWLPLSLVNGCQSTTPPWRAELEGESQDAVPAWTIKIVIVSIAIALTAAVLALVALSKSGIGRHRELRVFRDPVALLEYRMFLVVSVALA